MLALFLAGAGLLGAAQDQPLTIDPSASRVVVQVGKTGAFSFAGHTHEVIAPAVAGRVSYNAVDPSRSSISLEFDAAQLRVTGKGEPAGDVPEVQQTMLGEKVLDASRFQKIVFQSREIAPAASAGDGLTLRITGDLTIHGVTKPHTVVVTAKVGAGDVVASGKTTVKQTDFGIKPVTAGAGTVRVKDELAIEFSLRARR